MKKRAVLLIRAFAWIVVTVLPLRFVRRVQAEMDSQLFRVARRKAEKG